MIALPPGEYLMGAGPDDKKIAMAHMLPSELPQHRVTIKYSFALSKHEVTVDEFGAYVDETSTETGGVCELRLASYGPQRDEFVGTVKPGGELKDGLVTVTDANFRSPGVQVPGSNPATCISRLEAIAYLKWLSKKTGRQYRLPTESEWEYGARAGTSTPFHFGGNRKETCAYGNFADRDSPYFSKSYAPCSEKPSPVGAAPVGSYKPNPWGLFDMAGNVFEFTADCASPNYDNAPTDGSAFVVPGCKHYTVRSWTFEAMDSFLRSAARCEYGSNEYRSNMVGLRAAVTLASSGSALDQREAKLEFAD